jgi:hypothetical protein
MEEKCQHENFAANVDVHRLEGCEPMRFNADVRIECAECGLPFRFIGLPAGTDLNGAAVSVDATEARMAIAPKGQVVSVLEGAATGFSVRRMDDGESELTALRNEKAELAAKLAEAQNETWSKIQELVALRKAISSPDKLFASQLECAAADAVRDLQAKLAAAESREAALREGIDHILRGSAVVSQSDDGKWGAIIGTRMVRDCDTAAEALLALLSRPSEPTKEDGDA